MESVPCNICGCQQSTPIYHLADWMNDRPDIITTLVRCNECGLVFQSPRPTIEEMGQYYLQDYEPHTSYRAKSSFLLRKAGEYGLDKRARVALRDCPKPGRLLDVGCATGDFLDHVRRKYGWQVQGVELSETAAGFARDQFDLDVFQGTLEAGAFPDHSFDVVTMWDVLEHLHDPKASLREIHRILKPGGRVVLRIPNIDSWDAKIFGKYWVGYEPPRHLYVFGIETVTRLLAGGGFEILRMDTRSSRYLPFVLSLRFWWTGRQVARDRRERWQRLLQSPAARLASTPVFLIYGAGLGGPLLTVTAIARGQNNV